jgi:hypothetical protein
MKNRIDFKKLFFLTIVITLSLSFSSLKAQYLWNSDSAFRAGAPNSGRLWGYAFGDYSYKGHTDSLNRGGNNQYTGVPQTRSSFQFRRIYVGYDYNISKKFSAEFLLAAEDDFAGGDLLVNNKFTPYIKYMNIRWKDFVFKGNDLVVGLSPTPAYPYLAESIWSYRSIERTVSDIRRTPSFDFGASLQGRFFNETKTASYGYNLMVGNGQSAKPENDIFKWFYGDAFVRFLNNKLIFDIYGDYERLNWTPASPFTHHSRQMTKAYLAYATPALTIGVEGFINHSLNDVVGVAGARKDTLTANSTGISVYVHGNIVKDKLRFFARFDSYNPDKDYDNGTYTKYIGLQATYEPNNKEQFITAGLDFIPVKNVHFMPNIWYNKYTGQGANLTGSAAKDHDLVYRLTFYFTFGKFFNNPSYSYNTP